MRIEIINGHRVEHADEGKWLHNGKDNWERVFASLVYLGDGAPVWEECTEEAMKKWKDEHPEPVIDPEEVEAEAVES